MAKIVRCKSCGADVAKNAKTCPNCGAKVKKNTVLGILLVVIGILIVAIAMSGGNSGPEKVGEVGAETPNVTQSVAPDTFGVGDRVELNGVVVTLHGVSESNGDSLFAPDSGNVFVAFELEIENNTDQEIVVSSLVSFEAYFDDYAANFDLLAESSFGGNQLDGSVAAGKKMRGIVTYQAPADWSVAEIRYTPNAFGVSDVGFTYSK